jgi:hypothetical protein
MAYLIFLFAKNGNFVTNLADAENDKTALEIDAEKIAC